MKTKNLLLLVITVIFNANLNATVWRLNNLPGTDADLTTLQAANNAAWVNSGDTLYLEASAGSYGDLVATKQLVIIGAGYFLNENLNLQANGATSEVGKIAFNAGSQGSVIAGCTIYEIKINTSNLVIERNRVDFSETALDRGGIIFYTSNISNIIISNNYIKNQNLANIGSSYAIRTYSNSITGINNIIIKSNYVAISGNGSDDYAFYFNSGYSGSIENNVIYGYLYLNNVVFKNNILLTGTFTSSNSTFLNNIGNSTQFGTSNGNQQNVNMTNVFVGATGNSTDGQWQLKIGSPAIGAGVDGVDCGMFGGTTPYKLSGIPAIPSIYHYSQTIDNVNQQLNVIIKAKGNN